MDSNTYKKKLDFGYVYDIKEFGSEAEKLPFSLKVLLENVLRNLDGEMVTEADIEKILNRKIGEEIPYLPTRVILQDYTGIPLIVDLAAMRSKLKENPELINPKIPVDLVIDHSIQVEYFGTIYAFSLNLKTEFERNRERYAFLKWAQKAFENFRIVPPGKGIIHQVNLEYLAKVVENRNGVAFPDTLLGTDSHTTMINGIGVLGWGVGGIEAEAVMLGQPYYMPVPEVVGVKLLGELREGVTPTDLVLHITELLRKQDVVNKFVEFFGPSLESLSAQDRATIGNMAPEYGATIGFFPVDKLTLDYLRGTGRDESYVKFVENYCRYQGMFYEGQEPRYDKVIVVDLGDVE